jgi:hypothetical protein
MTHLEGGILQIVTTTRSQGKPLDFKWITRKDPAAELLDTTLTRS